MARIGLVYGYGQNIDGGMNKQSEKRCREALRLWKHGTVQKLYITVGVSKNRRLLAHEMFRYFLKRGVPATDIVMRPVAHNTAGETEVCRRMLDPGDEVTVISSWYHLPRVWCLWFARRTRVNLVPAWSANLVDLALEPLKLGNSILHPFNSAKMANPH